MLILLAAFLAASVQFNDVTSSSGITFKHALSAEKKYISESMSGGVALFDYDNDGYLDIFFVNSLTVEMVKANQKTRSALYRNNRDGTFSDVTDKAKLADVGWGMGCAVGDFNNDGFDDLYVTSIGPDHLFKNNGNGTFTDVTQKAGVSDPRFSTGAAFLDYDNDGKLDLFVTSYVGFDMNNLPTFGEGPTCQFKGVPVQCGPRGLPGAGDSLFRNNGDGTFTDVSKKAGVADARGYYGLDVVGSDFDGDGWIDI
ncbi:MAG TPA: VCBS repeat-containing protein, partial [Pyrinomonadaceae bacterium]